ncbi:1-alkyl-2-acetylglycerophosphocholine esterase [Fusarium austroafricanum]|uniref:1-alkyl-2-acetylglycerophosphocholine esterase n=1 Tax=Fusarium austroafricanum TaxID=2364996 RepID=A0A8H4KQJ1_9HYPO|nr:1-alkyl-2-acetylglycerophosphocholine esterase [Fusarium austroafricanum]
MASSSIRSPDVRTRAHFETLAEPGFEVAAANLAEPAEITEDADTVASTGNQSISDTDKENSLHGLLQSLDDNKTDLAELDTLLETITDEQINSPDENGQTPLHIAASRGLGKTVERLLAAGARRSITWNDNLERQPLHYACRKGNGNIVKKLLENEADIEAKGFQGKTPLLEACWTGHLNVVKVLLAQNPSANVNAVDVDGWSPLFMAAYRGHEEVVKCLLSETHLNLDVKESIDGFSALHIAAYHGYEGIVAALLQKGADHKSQDHEKWTPLHASTKKQSLLSMKELLTLKPEKLAEILDIPENEGYTPLLSASEDGFAEGVDLLIKAGAKINARSGSKSTALIEASRWNHESTVRVLLNSTLVDVNCADENGQTALHLASMQKSDAIARLFLSREVNVYAANNDGQTPLVCAFEANGEGETTRCIAEYIGISGPDDERNEALLWAAEKSERHAIVTWILSNIDLDVDGSERHAKSKWSPIEWASYRALPRILLLLLSSSHPGFINRQMIESAKSLHKLQQAREEQAREEKLGPSTSFIKGKIVKESSGKPKAIDIQPNSAMENRNLVNDILQDPSMFQINMGSEITEHSKPSDFCKEVSREFDATIVHMYRDEERLPCLRRIRTVEEVLYGKGPKELMKQANESLKNIVEKTIKTNSAGLSKQLEFMDSSPDLVWIQLPQTNIAWMEDILIAIMEQEDYSESLQNSVWAFLRDSWVEVPDRKSRSRTMRPRVLERSQDNKRKEERGQSTETKQKSKKEKNTLSAIYVRVMPQFCFKDSADLMKMPYLCFSTQHEGDDNDQRSFDNPYTSTVMTFHQTVRQRRERLKEAYSTSAIHEFLTLDEWYYRFETEEDQAERQHRNKTQIITKSLNRRGIQTDKWRLLRVNQLWVWILDEKWLITATNDPIDDDEDTLCEGVLGHLDKLVKARGSASQPGTPKALSRLIVDYCIGCYDRRPKEQNAVSRSGGSHCNRECVSIREIFSNEINKLGRERTELIDIFGSQPGAKHSRKQRPPLTASELEETSWKSESLSCDIKDVQDELNMLKSVVNHQNAVLEKLVSRPKSDKDQELSTGYILNDLEEMDKLTSRIQSAVDAARSLQQGQEAVRQGRIFMIFTATTIIFVTPTFILVFAIRFRCGILSEDSLLDVSGHFSYIFLRLLANGGACL